MASSLTRWDPDRHCLPFIAVCVPHLPHRNQGCSKCSCGVSLLPSKQQLDLSFQHCLPRSQLLSVMASKTALNIRRPLTSSMYVAPLQAAAPICGAARDLGLIVITAGAGDVIRLVPPLTVTEADIDQAVSTLKEAMDSSLGDATVGL